MLWLEGDFHYTENHTNLLKLRKYGVINKGFKNFAAVFKNFICHFSNIGTVFTVFHSDGKIPSVKQYSV